MDENETPLEEDAVDMFGKAKLNRNLVDLLKVLPSILEIGKNLSNNITINQIYGDNFSGDAQKIDFSGGNWTGNDPIENMKKEERENTEVGTAQINLSDYAQIYKYLSENQKSPYCSFLIVLAVLGECQYNLAYAEGERLYESLVPVEEKIANVEDGGMIDKREIFDITQLESTRKFGIRFSQGYLIDYGGRISTCFVSFSEKEHAVNVLGCVFKEFRSLYRKVTIYLTELICSERLTLYAASINAIKKMCIINPEIFIVDVVPKLLYHKTITSDIAIAEILCTIAKESGRAYSAEKYLGFLVKTKKDMHFYIITLLMCKMHLYNKEKIGKLMRPMLKRLVRYPKIEMTLEKIQEPHASNDDFLNSISMVYNIGERYAEYYIALVSELYDLLKLSEKGDFRKESVLLIILLFIKEDWKQSCLDTKKMDKFRDMVFIRLMLRDSDTVDKLVFLWTSLINVPEFSVVAKSQLEMYLVVRDINGLEEKEYRKLEAFFIRLAEKGKARHTILFFLRNLATRPRNRIIIAGRIYKKVQGENLDEYESNYQK